MLTQTRSNEVVKDNHAEEKAALDKTAEEKPKEETQENAKEQTTESGKNANEKQNDEKKTEQEKPAEDKVIATGVVSSTTTLKIRSGPSTTKTQVGTLNSGTKVSIFEIKKNVNGHDWGRIDKGWICLVYVK